MTVIIELRPDVEAGLAALAAEQGVSLTQYVHHLLEEQIPAGAPFSPAERADFWRQSVKGLPRTVPLADEVISRENLYDARG